MNNINTAQFSSIETFRDWVKRNGRIRMSVECFDNAWAQLVSFYYHKIVFVEKNTYRY